MNNSRAPLPSLLDGGDQAWLRLVMDSIGEAFGLLAPDFTILELNNEAMRIDGRAREAVIGQNHWIAYPGSEDSEVGALYHKAMAQRVPVALHHRYAWADGRISWFETRAFPVENGCLAIFYRDVTEREENQQRLLTSERRFKAAVTALEGVLWTNNAQGEMLGEQAGWASLTGQELNDYQGYGWAAAIHPDDAQPTIDAWRRAVAAKATFEFEHRVKRHDREWRLCAVRAVPITDSAGEIIEWVGIHRDITDTRADAFRLQQLAETIDAVFYVHELDDERIAYISRAYETIWGRSRDELYADARSFLASIHPEDRARVEMGLREQRAGKSTPMEYRLQFADGSEKIILDRPFHTTDPINGARRIVGLATEITEYRRAQDLLARNAETFSNLVTANPFGIYVINADFELIHVSRGAQRVFSGIDPLIGRDFEQILRILWIEPFATEAIQTFRRTLSTGEPFVSASTTERRANVDQVEAYDWRIHRITLPDGQYGVVCYFYDLSERTAYEEKLTQALADKDLLAREIDHRVKNSLTVVGSLLSMQRRVSASAETRAALDEAADRVLAIARVHERLHQSHELGVIAFGDYLKQLCEDLASSMRRTDVELDCQTIAVDLPADAAMSVALIANELVTNAFKHGCAGGATRITVQLLRASGALTLVVADNGAGIVVAASKKPSSLGLKMVQAMARQLRAKVTMPLPGEPARFSVSIPQTALLADSSVG